MDYFSLDFVRYGVYSSLSPIELEKHLEYKKGKCYKTLNDPEFLVVLKEKWSLKSCKSFEEFILSWLREYIFSSDVPLEYILKNYKRVYSTSKAIRVATRKERDDFCDFFLTKYPSNQNLLDNIAIGSLQRQDILSKEDPTLSRISVLTKACRLGMREFILTHNRYGRFRNILAIVMREELESSKKVSILDIVVTMKDVSVLTDPYYLNHPNVKTEFSREEMVMTRSPLLYRHFNVTIDDLLRMHPNAILGTKKLCKYYDEIGFDVWQRVVAKDVGGLEWLELNARKRKTTLIVEEHHSYSTTPETIYSVREGRAKCEGTANSDYYTAHSIPVDMIEWFEAKLILIII